MDFLVSTTSAIISSLLVGCFFLIIENINRQKLFTATIKSLKNECEFNSTHRGNELSPFQTTFLEKALSLIETHDQCPDIATQASELLEFSKDANSGQLRRRKLTPQDVQNKMKALAQLITSSLKAIEARCRFWSHIYWWMGLNMKSG